MTSNKTKPTEQSVASFLASVSEQRREEAETLIAMMQEISGEKPVMWGPSIIGFGSMHYRYDTGREGDVPVLAFSPRKSSLTVYFEGFDAYGGHLEKLGKHKISRACLYINKLADIDMGVLRSMLEQSYEHSTKPQPKPETVDEYIDGIPSRSRHKFDELREIVRRNLPHADEVLSYGIVGYKTDEKRAKVYISGWQDHVALYPVPKSRDLQDQLAPYIRGKGTIWFALDEPLPEPLIVAVVKALTA